MKRIAVPVLLALLLAAPTAAEHQFNHHDIEIFGPQAKKVAVPPGGAVTEFFIAACQLYFEDPSAISGHYQETHTLFTFSVQRPDGQTEKTVFKVEGAKDLYKNWYADKIWHNAVPFNQTGLWTINATCGYDFKVVVGQKTGQVGYSGVWHRNVSYKPTLTPVSPLLGQLLDYPLGAAKNFTVKCKSDKGVYEVEFSVKTPEGFYEHRYGAYSTEVTEDSRTVTQSLTFDEQGLWTVEAVCVRGDYKTGVYSDISWSVRVLAPAVGTIPAPMAPLGKAGMALPANVTLPSASASARSAPLHIEAHGLSSCFNSASSVFERALKSGVDLQSAAAASQDLAGALCPDLDFTGLDLSPQAAKCKSDYLACAKGAAECRKGLLLCIGSAPEARGYQFEALEMDLGVSPQALLRAPALEFPTRDAAGREIGVLKVKSEGGAVKEAKWESRPIAVDFASAAPEVGKGEAKVDLSFKVLPESARMKMTLKRDGEAKKAIEAQMNLKVKDVAFSVDLSIYGFNPQPEPPGKGVLAVNIGFKAGKAWADKHGPSNVKVFRQSDGMVKVLDTKFKGFSGDLAEFEAMAPGLSVFSLAAVEPAAAPPAKSPGFEAALSGAALLAALIWVRRRANA